MLPDFQNTITWGAVIQIFITAMGLVGVVYALKTDIGIIKNNIYHLQEAQKTMAEAFSQLGKILTQVAVQDNRINMIEKRVDEIAHGKGMVN